MKIIARWVVVVLFCVVFGTTVQSCRTTTPQVPAGPYYDVDLDGTNTQGRLVQ